jgi:sugar lactone lactonase YvrE
VQTRTALRLLLAAFACVVALAGTTASASAAELSGRVLSGDVPIASSRVTLYRTVPGSAPDALGAAMTAADGSFELGYRVTAGGAFYALVSGPEQRGIVRLAAVLGTAPIPGNVVINERTTVAAGFALAQFVTDSGGIAGSSPGLPNAAAMAANLADVRTGRAATVLTTRPNGRATSTLRAFDSLANMLVPCARAASACSPLFRLATPPGERSPRSTLEVVANIARNPGERVGALFDLARSGPQPYRPALRRSQQPAAWTLALRFDGDGMTMDGPGNFAIDRRGHIWVTNNYVYSADVRRPACGSDLLLEFTPDGRYAPGSPHAGGGLSGAGFGITFDPDGNLWIGNFGFAAPGCDDQPAHDSVSKFSPDGQPLSPGGGFSQGSISWPQGTVSDREGSIWIANCGNDSVTLYPNGDPSAARHLTGLGIEKPFDIAINQHGQAFVTAVGNDRVAMLNPDGSPTALSPISGGGLNQPMGIAVDSRGNMWVSNSGLLDVPCPSATQSFSTRGGSLTLIGSDGVPRSDTAFTGGGLTIPWGIAVDGDDNVWVANFGQKRLSHFCGLRPETCPPGSETGDAISPDGAGYGFDGLVRNTGVAVDPSGNVWLANNWKTGPIQTNPGGYQIVAFIGLAAPIETPLIGPPRQP